MNEFKDQKNRQSTIQQNDKKVDFSSQQIENKDNHSKDQDLEEGSEVFIDKDFPPKIESINEDIVAFIDKILNEKKVEIVFKRVNEVIKDIPINLFYNDTTSIHDVKQGYLGNCYLISCLIAISQYPDIVKSLFKNKSYNKSGKYSIKLIKNGIPTEVVVDDHLPCYPDGRGFFFSQSPSNTSIWVSLLEKSLAKIHKSYIKIEAASPKGPNISGVFMHLLGCPSEFQYIEKGQINSFKDINHAWEQIYGSYNKGYLQTTSITKKEIKGEIILDSGLVANHVYSILEVRKIDKLKLIKLKNPWAKIEWKLDWSDESPKWTEYLKNEVALEVKDDGVFWMSFEDFYQNFCYVSIAYFNPNYKYSYLEIKNEDQFAYFTYNLSLEQENNDIEGYFLLHQVSERFLVSHQGIPFKASSISFCIFEMNQENTRPTALIASKYENKDMTYSEIRFQQGKKYQILIIVDFLTSSSKNVVLSLYANKKVNFQQSQLIRSSLKTIIDYLDIIELSQFQDYYDKQAYWFSKKYGSLLVYVLRNVSDNQILLTDLQIANGDSELVRESLIYNIDSQYQEMQKNKFKIALPSGKSFKLIFKQTSFNCLNVGLGFTRSSQLQFENLPTDEQIDKQISNKPKQNLVTQQINGEIYKQEQYFDIGFAIKIANTTKDKTYIKEIKFKTTNLKFINSHNFEMNQNRFYTIKVPPQTSIILKFEKINYNSQQTISYQLN